MTRREKLEARAERRHEWAESRGRSADAAHERVHQIADQIPFGQPILVGHHSEGRARRDQSRIESGMRSAVDNANMATHHEQKAQGIEAQLARSIFSDDADAVERLEEKIAGLEEKRERVKRYNATARKGAADTSILNEGERANLETIARVCPYQLGKGGALPSYELSSVGAEIRRCRDRIVEIQRNQAAAESGERVGGRMMTSRYAGECGDCGGPIARGDMIVWYRSTREAVHHECPKDAAAVLEP